MAKSLIISVHFLFQDWNANQNRSADTFFLIEYYNFHSMIKKKPHMTRTVFVKLWYALTMGGTQWNHSIDEKVYIHYSVDKSQIIFKGLIPDIVARRRVYF